MTTKSAMTTKSVSKDGKNEGDVDQKFLLSPMKGRQELPIVSIAEGFRNKPSLGLRTCNHVLLTLDGRDKVTKLLQYLCRLLAWWLQQQQPTKIASSSQYFILRQLSNFFIAERFATMKNSLATSRKAFRLGRSMIEFQKLNSLGILQWIDLYLKRSCSADAVMRPLQSILHSMIRPLAMNATTTLQSDSTNVPFWNIAGNSLKSLGLLIFWAADNVSFLHQSGFLDDYQLDPNERLNKRSQQVAISTIIANRSYFIAAIAGLVTNWKTYWSYTTKHLMELKQDNITLESNGENNREAVIKLQKAQEKQFTLFVALVKSVCDVLVFSNNAGVDLWKKYRGRPLHEGLHCFGGMVSAAVVLYNNYPNISDME